MDGVDCDLEVAAGAVLKTDRHAETGSKLAVELAFGCAGTDGSPTDEISIELRAYGIEKFGAGSDAFFSDITKQCAGDREAFVDVE